MAENQPARSSRWWYSKTGLTLLGFAGVAAFFLVTEHRAHVFGILPFVLLLVCPLLHLFHRGHGGHGHGSERDREP